MIQIINGNALDELKKLPDVSVDCVITSPPYYGLRAYKYAETIWGGNPECKHEWSINISERVDYTGFERNRSGLNKMAEKIDGHERYATTDIPPIDKNSVYCSKCGAWKGQLGLEPNYQMYLGHLLMITEELKRVLKATGTLFWNMGDSYSGKMGKRQGWNDNELSYTREEALENGTSFYLNADYGNIPNKSLMMLPERFAIGMIEQGWILRNKIIWYKRNGMPSSVHDRYSNKWEYIFFFVQAKKYYFDLDAVRIPLKQSSINRIKQNVIDQFIDTKVSDFTDQNMNIKNILLHMQSKYLKDREPNGSLAGRVMRNIADGKFETLVREAITNVNQYLKDKLKASNLTVKQLAEMTGEKETTIAHYFRTDLSGVALPSKEFWEDIKDILNLDEYEKHVKEEYKSVIPTFGKGANPGDVIIHTEQNYHGDKPKSNIKHDLAVNRKGSYDDPLHTKPYNLNGTNPGDVIDSSAVRHKSWYSNAGHKFTHDRKYDQNADGGDFMNITTRPHKFAHFAVYPETLIEPLIKAGCPEGGTVLDPFAGSGTTGVVAKKFNRNAILIEISPEYIEIIKNRIGE